MSASFTESQVISLAPDASSVKAGQKLARSSQWTRLEYSAQAIWGEIKGSGKNPYQVRIDTEELAYKCSCPSRKFPCKHAIALLLLFASEKQAFSTASAPEWVQVWLNQRKAKEVKKAAAPARPVDEKAREKRIAKRETKVEAGLAEGKKWQLDIIRNGMIQLSERDRAYFEQLAARMIDAQAGGIAAMFRSLGQLNPHQEFWNLQALELLCRLWLLLTAYPKQAKLSEGIREEVRNLVGWNPDKESMLKETGIIDHWQVLGIEEWEENRITTQKYWVLGEQSEKHAFVLQYLAPGQTREVLLLPGMTIEAELVYYGAGISQRALFKNQSRSQAIRQLAGCSTFIGAKDELATKLAQNPWISQVAIVLESVIPVALEADCYLLDTEKRWLKLICSEEVKWKLLAISGGNPLSMAGLFDGIYFQPLGCMVAGSYVLLADGST